MDKKSEKGNSRPCVAYGFWTMIFLFVLLILLSVLQSLSVWQSQWPGLIAGILFVISIFFVFVVSIRAIAPPEKSMAYIALGIAILLLLYLLFSATLGTSASSVLK